MLKIWGRNTSSNVQMAMWAVGELGLPHQRIDIGGPFGTTPEYQKMNPNLVVPTLEEDDGFILWESKSIIRYLAEKHNGAILPKDVRQRARASQWMDWQLSVQGPAITPVFWGLVRTPPEKRDPVAIDAAKKKITAAMNILNDALGKTEFVAGSDFSYGDIPVGVQAYRYYRLLDDRPAQPNLDRWYAAISSRPAFKEQVAAVPFV
ncbi:glutathione S-transferase GstB [Variibacter gotjawalensis]|uniref:Glutathione S-transferase GstB n=1 Tax=Variibacter gotjawalensis TaxID=1333996 RepID=A0A0S3PQC5_9BRAD|nr:glutathione S-transferase [Variibacter gotjawalensis]NIK48421.1 glutathione S-transferase [Variibacter gotjawalensis]RZS50288.1 glutathione S-transferase [Variibacter gotjawalensis]BAT58121.1 glutathione S-transferase GstB [Variibacter gotjawalensis]